ncbi:MULTISPECIES: AidA/PixA family protein [Myxococcus]|uniref:AidA/PixA family protein n=1 Tax=Myxococcus TaxID=32 RepID=UPI001142BC84|nr:MULTISPECIES: AidA/PixA family protein [Myxococcus]MCK8500161.1 inclusion body family protein [Myxococcus fulvus]
MADTENTANVLIVVDAENLYLDYQGKFSTDSNHPVDLGEPTPYVYMFIRYDEMLSGQATDDLNIVVNTNNNIRWRITSLTGNTRFSVALNGCDILRGEGCITPPFLIEPTVTVPLPSVHGNQVTVDSKQTYQDAYFQATAVNPTTTPVVYTFTFALANNDGNILSYFSWDPKITITA